MQMSQPHNNDGDEALSSAPYTSLASITRTSSPKPSSSRRPPSIHTNISSTHPSPIPPGVSPPAAAGLSETQQTLITTTTTTLSHNRPYSTSNISSSNRRESRARRNTLTKPGETVSLAPGATLKNAQRRETRYAIRTRQRRHKQMFERIIAALNVLLQPILVITAIFKTNVSSALYFLLFMRAVAGPIPSFRYEPIVGRQRTNLNLTHSLSIVSMIVQAFFQIVLFFMPNQDIRYELTFNTENVATLEFLNLYSYPSMPMERILQKALPDMVVCIITSIILILLRRVEGIDYNHPSSPRAAHDVPNNRAQTEQLINPFSLQQDDTKQTQPAGFFFLCCGVVACSHVSLIDTPYMLAFVFYVINTALGRHIRRNQRTLKFARSAQVLTMFVLVCHFAFFTDLVHRRTLKLLPPSHARYYVFAGLLWTTEPSPPPLDILSTNIIHILALVFVYVLLCAFTFRNQHPQQHENNVLRSVRTGDAQNMNYLSAPSPTSPSDRSGGGRVLRVMSVGGVFAENEQALLSPANRSEDQQLRTPTAAQLSATMQRNVRFSAATTNSNSNYLSLGVASTPSSPKSRAVLISSASGSTMPQDPASIIMPAEVDENILVRISRTLQDAFERVALQTLTIFIIILVVICPSVVAIVWLVISFQMLVLGERFLVNLPWVMAISILHLVAVWISHAEFFDDESKLFELIGLRSFTCSKNKYCIAALQADLGAIATLIAFCVRYYRRKQAKRRAVTLLDNLSPRSRYKYEVEQRRQKMREVAQRAARLRSQRTSWYHRMKTFFFEHFYSLSLFVLLVVGLSRANLSNLTLLIACAVFFFNMTLMDRYWETLLVYIQLVLFIVYIFNVGFMHQDELPSTQLLQVIGLHRLSVSDYLIHFSFLFVAVFQRDAFKAQDWLHRKSTMRNVQQGASIPGHIFGFNIHVVINAGTCVTLLLLAAFNRISIMSYVYFVLFLCIVCIFFYHNLGQKTNLVLWVMILMASASIFLAQYAYQADYFEGWIRETCTHIGVTPSMVGLRKFSHQDMWWSMLPWVVPVILSSLKLKHMASQSINKSNNNNLPHILQSEYYKRRPKMYHLFREIITLYGHGMTVIILFVASVNTASTYVVEGTVHTFRTNLFAFAFFIQLVFYLFLPPTGQTTTPRIYYVNVVYSALVMNLIFLYQFPEVNQFVCSHIDLETAAYIGFSYEADKTVLACLWTYIAVFIAFLLNIKSISWYRRSKEGHQNNNNNNNNSIFNTNNNNNNN
eukprot:PhM_4_TR2905/c0_g1_i1/m.55246